MLNFWPFGLTLALAVVDWYAVAHARKRMEYVFKPATLLALILGVLLTTRHAPYAGRLWQWVLMGLGFSLGGDIFLMLPDPRCFLPGLGFFLLAHCAYITGLTPTVPGWQSAPLFVLAGGLGVTLYLRVTRDLRARGETPLLIPLGLYATLLSLMLFTALTALLRPMWALPGRLALASGGALFFASDTMLAWDRFVKPAARLKLLLIITYHLAQIGLALGVFLVV